MTSSRTASSTSASSHMFFLDNELGIIQASSLAIDLSMLWFSADRGQLLGSGSFGDVYSGIYVGEKVAITQIKIASVLEAETLVMARAGIHPNILDLHGLDLVGDFGGGPATKKQDLRRPNYPLWCSS
jgi:hypothetical protein